jgi:hypothetical protein
VICYWTGWTGWRAFDWYAEQKSAPIYLEGGQEYPVWALWKEGGGGDHCSVAWQGPDSPGRTVIDGYYLKPGFVALEATNLNLDGRTYTPLEASVLSFSEAAGATAHEVLLGEDGGPMSVIATLPAGENSVAISPEAGKSYNWQVNAIHDTVVAEGCPASFSVEEWVAIDIDSWGGSTSYDEATGVYTINGNGFDIWGNSDEFHYYYTTIEMTRDQGEIQARVLTVPETDHWSKAGVMIRETSTGNSRQAIMASTRGDAASLQYRHTTGDRSWDQTAWGYDQPIWVKLVRDGSYVQGYFSYDGENWTRRGGANIWYEPGKYVCVGLAVTSHNSGLVGTATFDNFSFSTPDPRQAWNLSPYNGQTGVPLHVILKWNAGDGATGHRVYFSDDPEAVADRSALVATLKPEVTEYNPIASARQSLDLGGTYYFTVDEECSDDEGGSLVVPGAVCGFTIEESRLIDNFESYDIEPEGVPPQVMIPGEVLVAAVPPPDQAWVDAQVLLAAVEPDPDCLVSRWDFEGDYTDSVSGYDGTPQGDATIVTDAERGNVLSLDGDMDYVDCGNPAELNFGTGNWTICAWVKNTMTGTGDINKGSIIANGGDGGGGHRYCLIVTEQREGKVNLVCDDNAAKRQTRADATVVNDDVWHHVMGVRDGDTISIYIDGIRENGRGVPAGYDLSGTSQANVLIGAITKYSDSSIYKDYAGLIDDVRIYDCALDAGNARYLAGLGDLIKPGYYSPCIVHWTMDEGAGDVANDDSGNNLHGTITDALWTATTADGSAACLDFDAGANVVNEDAGPYLDNLAGLSMSLWVQSDVIDTDKGFIIGRDPEGNDQRGIRYDTVGASSGGDDVIKFGVACSDGADESESSEMIQTTEWQHIVMVWDNDGSGTQLYVNGILNGLSFDGDNRTGLTAGYTKLLVGKGSKDGAADAGWDGRVDDVRIYDYRLSEGEVRYLAGIGDLKLPDQYVPMVLHMEFEGNLDDSSGNNYHGTPYGAIAFATDPDMGEVLDLPGGDNQYVGLPPIGIQGAMPRTISGWAKADHTSIPNWTLIFGFTTPGGGCGSHFNIGSLGGPGGVGAHVWCWEATIFSDQQALDWHHYAMTYDGGTVRYYGDGAKVGETGYGLVHADNFHVGSRATQPSSFPGLVDEVKVFNFMLNDAQILELSGAYVPVNPIGDTWTGKAAATPALEWKQRPQEGSKCMRIDYTGNGAVARLDPFGDGAHPHGHNGDWTLGGAKALSIWFKGDPDNAPGQMFAQLTTAASSGNTQRIMYDGDPEDLKSWGWLNWNIDLKELGTGKPADPIQGLPLTKIKEVGIGVMGGGGVLYVDNVRLYPTRCVPAYGPDADLTEDCVVNGEDIGVLGRAWLAAEGGNGLWYKYYEGWWNGYPHPGTPLITQGVMNNFGVGPRMRGDQFGFIISGIVTAPAEGDYTFYTSSDDGSRLYIDGQLVVNNDGWHGMQWREGTIHLIAGEHLIEVIMFEDGGGEGLLVEVAAPALGIARTAIPDEMLFLPPGIPADLNGDGVVNLKDYAVLTNSFLEEKLFP